MTTVNTMTIKSSKRRRISPISSVVCLLSLSISSEASPFVTPYHVSTSSSIMATWTLRGGASHGAGGGGDSSAGDLDDEELDEYIDFLLAAADDKVTEADNPLFKRFRELAEVEGSQESNNGVLSASTTTFMKPMEHVTVDTVVEPVEEENSDPPLSNPSSPVMREEEMQNVSTPESQIDLSVLQNVTLDIPAELVEESVGESLVSPSIDESRDDGLDTDRMHVNLDLGSPTVETTSEPVVETSQPQTIEVQEEEEEPILKHSTGNHVFENATVPVDQSDREPRPLDTMDDTAQVEENVLNLDTTVWDVDDVDQLDEMIETLVAAVEDQSSTGREDENLATLEQEVGPVETLEGVDLEINNEEEEENMAVLVDSETSDEISQKELLEGALTIENTVPNATVTETSIGNVIPEEEETATIESPAVEILMDEEERDQEADESSAEVVYDVSSSPDVEVELESVMSLKDADDISPKAALSISDPQDTPVSVIEIDEASASTSAIDIETNLQLKTSDEQVVEFFLGPSAVDESPQLAENVMPESRQAAPAVMDLPEEIKEEDVQVAADDAVTIPADTIISDTQPTVNVARKTWGKWTALLLGITTENKSAKASTRSYTPTWGRWTARLMGIQTEKLAGTKSIDGAGAPKKDIDRIYKKYFLDYTPEPFTVPSGTEAELDSSCEEAPMDQDENPVQQEETPSRLNVITRLWGTLDKAMKHERSKPLTFLVGSSHNVTGNNVNQTGTVVVAFDEEEKSLETEVVDSQEDGEVENVDVVADAASEEAIVTTATSEEPFSFDEEIVEVDVDVPVATEAECVSFQEIGSVGTDQALLDVSTQEVELEHDDIIEEEEDDDDDEEENLSPSTDEIDVAQVKESSSTEIGDVEEESLTRQVSADDEASPSILVETIDALASGNDEEGAESELGAQYNSEGESLDRSDSGDTFLSTLAEDIDEERFSTFEEGAVSESINDEEFEVEDSEQPLESDGLSDIAPPLPLKVEGMHFFQTFLVMRGLEAWVMTIILFIEWCRFYLSPALDLVAWVADPNDISTARVASLRDSIVSRLRGGSEANNTLNPSTDDVEEGSQQVNQNDSITNEAEKAEIPAIQVAASIPRPRPNALYRYLFSYGRLGHLIIMELVLLHEWMETYLPSASTSIKWAIAQMFPRVFGQVEQGDLPLSQTTGFVGADGSAVRGAKKRSSQMKKEDQRALDQLKKVGDVSQARYRFLSEGFMRRHGIGRYAEKEMSSGRRASEIDDFGVPSSSSDKGEVLTVSEPESDAEWIVSALTQNEEDASEQMSSGRKGLSKPTVTVGLEIGRRPRSRKKRSAIADPTWLTSEREKKQVGPRVSDRDSGVMGRIRAAGANSLVGRNILGAYPGDVPAPSEAANPRGLIDFAQRYGYGEWSDSDEDNLPETMGHSRHDEDDENDGYRRKKKRRRKSSQKVELNIGVGIGTKSSSTPVPTTRARLTPRQKISERKDKNMSGVGKAGLDAFEKSATRRKKDPDSTKQNPSGEATKKLQAAKALMEKTGSSSVASKALEQLKEKAKRSDDSR